MQMLYRYEVSPIKYNAHDDCCNKRDSIRLRNYVI